MTRFWTIWRFSTLGGAVTAILLWTLVACIDRPAPSKPRETLIQTVLDRCDAPLDALAVGGRPA